jgi:hypothetical protein
VLEHPRYSIAINVGYGPVKANGGTVGAATMAGMIKHDITLPVVDFIIYNNDDGKDATGHLGSYLAGIQELSRFHLQEGRTKLANAYAEIEQGLAHVQMNFQEAVSEVLLPIHNKLVITPIPEFLQFVKPPRRKGYWIPAVGVESLPLLAIADAVVTAKSAVDVDVAVAFLYAV